MWEPASNIWELLGRVVIQESHQERRIDDFILGWADPRDFYQRLIWVFLRGRLVAMFLLRFVHFEWAFDNFGINKFSWLFSLEDIWKMFSTLALCSQGGTFDSSRMTCILGFTHVFMFTARVTEFCLTLFATGIVRYYIILCFAFGRFDFNMYFLIGTSLLLLLGCKDMFLHVSEINHILSNLVSWQQADIIRCTFLIIDARFSKCWFPHTWKELAANGVPSQEPYASRMLPACTLYGPKAKNPLHGEQAK